MLLICSRGTGFKRDRKGPRLLTRNTLDCAYQLENSDKGLNFGV